MSQNSDEENFKNIRQAINATKRKYEFNIK